MTLPEIAAAVVEVTAALAGGAVVRVRSPWPHHLSLTVRCRGRNHELLVGVAPDMARLHLVVDAPPTPPGVVPPFVLRARALLRPARVVGIERPGGGRVVRIAVSRHGDAAGQEWQSTLVAELLPRGRLLLLDGAGRVLMGYGPGGMRGLKIGEAYTAPAEDLADAEDVADAGAGVFAGPVPDSAALESRYAGWMAVAHRVEQRRQAARTLGGLRRRVARRLKNMQADLARHTASEQSARTGELLAAHRHLLRRGLREVAVTDWFSDACPQLVVPLRAECTPEENIEVFFQAARRARRGIPVLQQRIAEAMAELERVDAARRVLDEGGTPEAALAVAGIFPSPAAEADAPAGRKAADARFRVRAFLASDGRQIRVGRSSTENDRITFRMARGNDLWLHARDVPGSHVVIHGKGEPSQQTIQEAAQLAAHFSRLKQEGGGEVICTPRKNVRRPKGGKPGQALVTGEKVIQVRLDAGLVARLLARRV
ncbi:MAG: NFACT RNA binding domain-containing protein [Nitrospirota bacterium]|nr:NFACT RNA binding domain-containing protein [Nitrospirota bacterium]